VAYIFEVEEEEEEEEVRNSMVNMALKVRHPKPFDSKGNNFLLG
jgi:hypothetical protein